MAASPDACHSIHPIPPTETVSHLQVLMARMGITRIADLTGLDRIGMPVVAVYRPNSRSLAVSQGKGLDLASATMSGLMEAAELHHAEHIDLPMKFGSYADLEPNHALVDVDRLARITPRRFDRHVATLWAESRDLLSGEARWLPFECVRANFTLPAPPGSGWFDCSSNGLAAGVTWAAAVRHGLCEVIERDATALWNGLADAERRITGLDPGSVADPKCRLLMDMIEAADFDVAAWETTTDFHVPAFFALIADRRDPLAHCGIGAGAHPLPAAALLRALTEAVQVRTTYVSGARDDLRPEEYGEAERRRRRRQADRLLAEHAPIRDLASIPGGQGASAEADVAWIIDQLRRAGIEEVLVVDLSKDWAGISVVRVVVPGLEGPDDHAAYVPGERAVRYGRSHR